MYRPDPYAPTLSRLALLGVASLTLALGACELTEGEAGLLSFRDTNIGDASLSDGLGVGATVELEVSCIGCQGDVVIRDATSNAPNVAEVVSYVGDRVFVRGLGVGSAAITVDAGDAEDTLILNVVDVIDAAVRYVPWPAVELPADLWEDGFGVLPGESFEVRAFPRGPNGRTVGAGAITWDVSPEGSGGASVEALDESPDSARVTAPTAADTAFTMTPTVGEALDARTVALDDIDTLALVRVTDGARFDATNGFEIEADSSAIVHLAAFDAAGGYVAGRADEDVVMSVEADNAELLTDLTATLGEGAEGSPTAQEVFPRGLLIAAGSGTGSGTATFAWAGRTLSVPFEVVPEPAQR